MLEDIQKSDEVCLSFGLKSNERVVGGSLVLHGPLTRVSGHGAMHARKAFVGAGGHSYLVAHSLISSASPEWLY